MHKMGAVRQILVYLIWGSTKNKYAICLEIITLNTMDFFLLTQIWLTEGDFIPLDWIHTI